MNAFNNNVEEKKIRDMLWAVPDSYDDFVNSTADCMEQDGDLKEVIVELLQTKPASDSGDVLKVLCDFYGFNKPLEIVGDDDDEEFEVVTTAARTGGMVGAAY